MRNRNRNFSKNIQQEQEEFERKSKQGIRRNIINKYGDSIEEKKDYDNQKKYLKDSAAKESTDRGAYQESQIKTSGSESSQVHFNQNVKKEEEDFRKRNAQNPDNTRVGSPHTYQKDSYIKEQTAGSIHQESQVKTSGSEPSQVRFNQNVKKEEEDFRKRNAQNPDNTRVGSPHTYQKDSYIKEQTAGSIHQESQVKTSGSEPSQVRFNQNVKKEEEDFRKRNAQNPDNTRVGSPHTYQKDSYIKEQTAGSIHQESQVKTSGSEPSQVRFNQNVKKEEEDFRKRNAQNPDNTRVGSLHTYQKDGYIKEQTGGSIHQESRIRTSGPESSQAQFNRNVKKEEEDFRKYKSKYENAQAVESHRFKGKTELKKGASYNISIQNDKTLPSTSMRAIGVAQPKREELNLKNFRTPSMLPYRITGIEKTFLATGAKYLIATTTNGTDTRKGAEYAADIYGTSAQFITDQLRIAVTKSMIRESNKVLNSYHDILKQTCGENGVTAFGIIGNISSYKDTMRMQKGVNSILIAKYGKAIKGTGWVGYLNAMRFLAKNKNNLDPEIRDLIKNTFKRTSSIQMLKGNTTRFRAIKNLGRRKIRRYLQQTDAGYGLYFSIDIVSRTNSIFRSSIFAVRSILKATEKAMLLAAKTTAWAAARSIKLASKLVPDTIKQTKTVKKIKGGTEKIGHAYKRTKEVVNKGSGRLARTKQNIAKFKRNPFGIRTGMNNLGKKATGALTRRLNRTILAKPARALGKGYRFLNGVISSIGRVFSAIGTAISTVIHLILMGLLIIILCGFILSLFSSIVTMIFSLFDFNAHDKDIREACLKQIEECYENQTKEFTRLRAQYRNVTLHYENIKDEDIYEEKEIAIHETTNSAEILSMAVVYFDFDIEKAGKKKVTKYVEELYNGSHIMSIIEKPYTYQDSDGNDITVTDADVTLTTYYFNQLFNCELKTGSSGVIAGSEITEQVWNYLRSAGVPAIQVAGIMGNMQAESGFNPNVIEYGNGIGFGLCQWSYGRRTALENYAKSKGKSPGDLEIQLEFLLTELGPGNFNSYHTGENNYNGFMNASDPETAAYYFMWGWERPAVWAGNSSIGMRQTAARTYYDTYKDREIITEEPEENEE